MPAPFGPAIIVKVLLITSARYIGNGVIKPPQVTLAKAFFILRETFARDRCERKMRKNLPD
ncbi:hypothetical protein THIOSC15_280020 [uncultured Thiomicrorhabdus sp.]